MDRRINYVYLVFRPNGVPLYVGKGSGDRWKRHAARAKSNSHYANVLKQAGSKLPIAIIAYGLTESEAFSLEKLFTSIIGIEANGGPLVNCGHGGRGGPTGIKRSKEWRAVRRLRAIELWRDETYRARMLRADRKRSGNWHPRTEAFKAVVSEKLKGNTHSLGRHQSVETRAKMKAKWDDPLWRDKTLKSRRESGMYSPEACAKRWATRRAKKA